MKAKKPTQQTIASFAAVAAMVVCVVVPPAAASLKNPVTVPVKISGCMLLMVNPNTGSYQFSDWGQATQVGRYSDTATGVIDLANGRFIAGQGTIVAANGDTIDWAVGAPNEVVYTGGTGRFQGVTGGFPATITSLTPLSLTPALWTLQLTYTGSGDITF